MIEEQNMNWIKNYYHITEDGKYVLRCKQTCCGGQYIWSLGKLTALREETIEQGQALNEHTAQALAEKAYHKLLDKQSNNNHMPKELPRVSAIINVKDV